MVRNKERHSRFHKPLLDLPAGEGPEAVPSRIATAPERSSVEMGSSLYGFRLGFAKDKVGFQRHLGCCGQTDQDDPLHSRKVHISSGLVGSVINQGDNMPARDTSVHSIRPGHQVHLSILEKSLESTKNSVEVQYSVPFSNRWTD